MNQPKLIFLLTTWIICPVLSAFIAAGLFKLIKLIAKYTAMHMIMADAYTRPGRIVAEWVATPFVAGIICFIGLFFLKNVFLLTVA